MKRMIYILVFSCIVAVFEESAVAQSYEQKHIPVEFSTAGSYAFSEWGSVSFTVGQVNQASFNAPRGGSHQGIQQPIEYFSVSSEDLIRKVMVCTLFPNPVTDRLTVSIADDTGELMLQKVHYSIYDLTGKRLVAENMSGGNTRIELADLASGCYWLKLSIDHGGDYFFKIIKI